VSVDAATVVAVIEALARLAPHLVRPVLDALDVTSREQTTRALMQRARASLPGAGSASAAIDRLFALEPPSVPVPPPPDGPYDGA
jgi:hypothetical protein